MKVEVKDKKPIIELVMDAIEGKIFLPFFQRDYQWGSELKERFFESFLRGDYLSSIIIAEVRKELGIEIKRNLELITLFENFNGNEDYEDMQERYNLLIDGQQRITSLIEWLFADLIALNEELNKDKGRRKYKIPFVTISLDDKSNFLGIYNIEYKKVTDFIEMLVEKEILEYKEEEVKITELENINETKDIVKNKLKELYEKFKDADKPQKLASLKILYTALFDVKEYLYWTVNLCKLERDGKITKVTFPSFLMRFVFLSPTKNNVENMNDKRGFLNRSLLAEKFPKTFKEYVKEKNVEYEKYEELIDIFQDLKENIKVTYSDEPKQFVTLTIFNDIKNVEELAELFERVNTVQLKLGYFDIMKAVLAVIDNRPFDFKSCVDEIINESGNMQYVSLLSKDKRFYEYLLRGFVGWFQYVYDDNITESIWLFGRYKEINNRKISAGEFLKKLLENYRPNGDKASLLRKSLKKYITSLDDALKKFNIITNQFTLRKVASNYVPDFKGSLLFYALPLMLEVAKSDRNKYKSLLEFSKYYLYALFSSFTMFRTPEKLFDIYKEDAKIPQIPKITFDFKNNEIRFIGKYDVLSIISSLKDDFDLIISGKFFASDLEYLSEGDYYLMVFTQSLYRYIRTCDKNKTYEELDKCENPVITLDGYKISFDNIGNDIDVHHIFPKKSFKDTAKNALNLALIRKNSNTKISSSNPKEYWEEHISSDNKEHFEYNFIPVGSVKGKIIKHEEHPLPDYSKDSPEDFYIFMKYRLLLYIESLFSIFDSHDSNDVNDIEKIVDEIYKSGR